MITKFRVWDKSLKLMIYKNENFEELYIRSKGLHVINPYEPYVFHPHRDILGVFSCFESVCGNTDLTILQWTGMIDKRGTDIYEGDIFLFQGKKLTVARPYEHVACLSFYENDGDSYDLSISSYGCVEGNIYENQKNDQGVQ